MSDYHYVLISVTAFCMFVLGFGLGFDKAESAYQRQAVAYGYGTYDTETKEFVWKR